MNMFNVVLLVLLVRAYIASNVAYDIYRPRHFSILTMSNVPFFSSSKTTKPAGFLKQYSRYPNKGISNLKYFEFFKKI